MSTLNVSNITDGTDTVETGYVLNGSAKAWVNFNGQGTIATRDSLNIASLTDQGTGIYDVNYTSNMSSSNYSLSQSNRGNRPADGDGGLSENIATKHRLQSRSGNINSSFEDADRLYSQVFGDLA